MMLREPWRTRLLFLSFAINLVAVPMVGYRYIYRHGPPIAPGPPPAEFIINHMAERLPSDDAQRLRTAMEPHVEQIQIERIHMEAARKQMLHVLSDQDFDRDTARSAMQKWQASWAKWSRALGEAMLDGFAQISPDGRKTLGELTADHR